MIVFDTTTLSAIWIPGATVNSRKTKKPTKHARERVELLIEGIAAEGWRSHHTRPGAERDYRQNTHQGR